MRILKMSAVISVAALVVLAAACGSDDGGAAPAAASGGGTDGAQLDGRAAQSTPTPAAAQAVANQASVILYAGGYGGSSQTESLTAAEATDNVGKSGTVCGLVASSSHEPDHTYKITVLNFEKAEGPDFFVYFWHDPLRIGNWPDKADRSIDLATYFNDRQLCVEGRIELYRDTPSINANYWHQYEFQGE